jgi:hypothetical protein
MRKRGRKTERSKSTETTKHEVSAIGRTRQRTREAIAPKPAAGRTRKKAKEIIEMSEVEQHLLEIYGTLTFEEAMQSQENFYAFLTDLEAIEGEFERGRFAEMLLIAAKAFPLKFLTLIDDPDFPNIDKKALRMAKKEAKKCVEEGTGNFSESDKLLLYADKEDIPKPDFPENVEGNEPLEILSVFERSDYGQYILKLIESASFDEILSDTDKAHVFLKHMEAFQDKGLHPAHFRAFMGVLTERQPDMVYSYFKELPYAVINDNTTLQLVIKLLSDRGYEVSEEMFKEPSEPPEIKWD